MTVDPAVLVELGHLRTRLPELSASVLATADGMVVAHDAQDIEPDSLAALAAAHLALARRFAHAVNHGELRESVVECDAGYITSYAAGPNALLTLVTSGDANLAMVHHEARRCVRRLVSLLTVELPQVRTDTPTSGIPTQAGPSTPLARRTPMATLPNAIRRRQAAG
jgi:predicted regulator of Ras-like GTPase activity (Roadblock/LC7/MglB family)